MLKESNKGLMYSNIKQKNKIKQKRPKHNAY